MKNNLIIFSDFDGTITNRDVLDGIITEIYSFEKYKQVENELLSGKLEYEKYLFDMFDGIKYNLSDLPNDLIDLHFYYFYQWIIKNKIDFYIISSGFKKIIETLVPYINNKIIYGNDIIINDNYVWKVELYDKINNLSINKNNIINKFKKDDFKTIFIGDGLSDFKVMGNIDYLFCKKNSLLHEKCIKENIEFIVYENFNDILNYLL